MVVFMGPRVSKARGWKMWEDGRDDYFAAFPYMNFKLLLGTRVPYYNLWECVNYFNTPYFTP